MARPSRLREQRRELMPKIADVFAELGYRRTTTAALARSCGVQENILYRLWPDKKAMFIAAVEYVYDFSEQTWLRLMDSGAAGDAAAAQRLLDFESEHHGEFGHYRITFSGLGEIDDPDIRDAVRQMYVRFHRFMLARILAQSGRSASALPANLAAWALIGLGTIASISRELDLLTAAERTRLIAEVGRRLLEGGAT